MSKKKSAQSIVLSFDETASARKSYHLSRQLLAQLKKILLNVLAHELSETTQLDLHLVALGDEEMLELNTRTMGHQWYTDIITFPLDRTGGELSAEIYVSVERALANAKRYHNTIEEELIRLGIHGVLHLAGYDDHSAAEKKRMRARERFFLQ